MADTINAAALAILRGAEHCRLTAYPDPGSGGAPWTIGWARRAAISIGGWYGLRLRPMPGWRRICGNSPPR